MFHCLSHMDSMNQAFPPSLADLMVPPKWIGRPRAGQVVLWCMDAALVSWIFSYRNFYRYLSYLVHLGTLFFKHQGFI